MSHNNHKFLNDRGAIGSMYMAILLPALMFAIGVLYDMTATMALKSQLQVLIDSTLQGVGSEYWMRKGSLSDDELKSRLKNQLRYSLSLNTISTIIAPKDGETGPNCIETDDLAYTATVDPASADVERNKIGIHCSLNRKNTFIGTLGLDSVGFMPTALTTFKAEGEYALAGGTRVPTAAGVILNYKQSNFNGIKARNSKDALKKFIDSLSVGDFFFIVGTNNGMNGYAEDAGGSSGWNPGLLVTMTQIVCDTCDDEVRFGPDPDSLPHKRKKSELKNYIETVDLSEYANQYGYLQGAIHFARKFVGYAAANYGADDHSKGIFIISDGNDINASVREDRATEFPNFMVTPHGNWWIPPNSNPGTQYPVKFNNCSDAQANNTGGNEYMFCYDYWNHRNWTPIPPDLSFGLHAVADGNSWPNTCTHEPSSTAMAAKEADLGRRHTERIGFFAYLSVRADSTDDIEKRILNTFRRITMDPALPACWNKAAYDAGRCTFAPGENDQRLVRWQFKSVADEVHNDIKNGCDGWLEEDTWDQERRIPGPPRVCGGADFSCVGQLTADTQRISGGFLLR